MAISLKDIMKLPSLSEIKLIAGEKGLDNFIEWVYVAECFEDPIESIQYLQGNELIIITGRSFKDIPNLIEKVIQSISDNKGRGLIVNVGKYIKKVPKKAIDLANKLNIPLFELPWHVQLVKVSQEVCKAIILSYVEENSVTHFLSNILFGDGGLDKNAVEKAAYFGYDISGNCYVCKIDIDNFREYLKENSITDHSKKVELRSSFYKIVQDVLDSCGLKVPIIHRDDSLIILCKKDALYDKKIKNVFKNLYQDINNYIPDLKVNIGIGNTYSDLSMIKNSLKEAQWALSTINIRGMNEYILKYKDIGIYSLLFNINNRDVIEAYYNSRLSGVLEYDKINSSSLAFTLETYLDENCNVTATAEKLFIHRNTLKYRLRKIEELLNCNLHNFKDCAGLQIAFDSKKVISKS